MYGIKLGKMCVWNRTAVFPESCSCHSFLDNPSFNQYLYVVGKRGNKYHFAIYCVGLLNTRGFSFSSECMFFFFYLLFLKSGCLTIDEYVFVCLLFSKKLLLNSWHVLETMLNIHEECSYIAVSPFNYSLLLLAFLFLIVF